MRNVLGRSVGSRHLWTLVLAVCTCSWEIAVGQYAPLERGGTAQQSQSLTGAAIGGLTAAEQKNYEANKRRFIEEAEAAQGLGPLYNGTSCADCHDHPSLGGVGNLAILHVGTVRNGRYVAPEGGDILHLHSAGDRKCQPEAPKDAANLSRRVPTPLFGAGLIEAIPDAVIRTWEDPADRDGDGIHGRAAIVTDPATHTSRVGRFGWKAQQATLLAFAGAALRDEIGITNDMFPNELGMGLSQEQLKSCGASLRVEDPPDPATHLRRIDQLAGFMRLLASPPPLLQSNSAHRGQEIFTRIGCPACHVPEMLTGASDIPALDHQRVDAYSDFLLHDVGTGDGVEQGAAMGNEFRTSPLWGLRYRVLLMHDGSALNPTDAIEKHHEEGERSRLGFDRLSQEQREDLLNFLNTI